MFDAVVTGETKRVYTRCDDEASVNKHLLMLRRRLLDRGYLDRDHYQRVPSCDFIARQAGGMGIAAV